VEELGYKIIQTNHIIGNHKWVSANAKTRAKEFMQLYEDVSVKAIIPPNGGHFLMEMLPYLDFEKISELPPKWVVGYSDTTGLLLPLTIICDVATIHGSNLGNMGFDTIHDMDLFVFDVMNSYETTQKSSKNHGWYTENFDAYNLNKKTLYKSLNPKINEYNFSGVMIGGCLDVICKILGTKFTPIEEFLEKYKEFGFIWTLESNNMSSADIYRTLWQMRECEWFKYCNGILFGRPNNYSDVDDFTLIDALENTFNQMEIPVIYDADIGHLIPQIQIVNGSYGTVNYSNGKTSIKQVLKLTKEKVVK